MMNDAMMLMKSRHDNTKQHLTGLARRAFFLLPLLLSAFFVSIPVQAQTAAQWAEMPDAFETMDPASIIGDGNYYYIQFYTTTHVQCGYLTDCGVDQIARSKDFLPYANNRLWTLEPAGETNQFKLKNKAGHYLYLETGGSARVRCADNSGAASVLKLTSLEDGYDISAANNDSYPMARNNNDEWSELICNFTRRGSRNDWTRLRFAKLKSTAAFIIYYRGEGIDNSNPDAATTRHYLTYSETGNEDPARDQYFRESTVSSRQSIIPSDKPLCTLPTLAAYHQDGLWTLEEAGADGQFYVKKYGTEEYLNAVQRSGDNFFISDLGTKNDIYGKYKLEDQTVNRYTRILNVQYQTNALSTDMFYNWDGYGNNPTQGTQATVDNNVGTAVTGGTTIIGPQNGGVEPLIYADLSNYTKMVIRGTQGMALRVLMNRQETNQGPWFEKNVTIGSDGTAMVDLNTTVGTATVKSTFVNGDVGTEDTSYGEVTTAYIGYNKISMNNTVNLANQGWGENDLAYLQVDASSIDGTITKVMLAGEFQGNTNRDLKYGVGYNNSTWSSTLTWNTADRSITTLGGTKVVERNKTEQTLSFDITGAFTDSKVKTILVYKADPYQGYIKNPRVYVEYIPNNGVTCSHLNAIKAGWGDGGNGTVTSISLVNQGTENSSSPRYIDHAKGDGWQVLQWTGTDSNNDDWYAGFYPVEVPVPNKDEFFQVLLGLKPVSKNNIRLTGGNMTVSDVTSGTTESPIGATFTPTAAYQNAFQYKNLNTRSYKTIVIKFGSAVLAGWQIHTYGGQYNGLVSLEGLTEYTINLTPGTNIDDFTIFNTAAGVSPLVISEIYYTPDFPLQMVNYNGGASPYSEEENERLLWQLEQVDDYTSFRVKQKSTGKYLKGFQQMTDPNDPDGAEIKTNLQYSNDFALKWFYVNPVDKEIPVDYMVTHRISYLKQYADTYAALDLEKQGLATEAQSDWWNYDKRTQKVNHFEITHYVKRGETIKVGLPTVLNKSNDHVYYQRWYNYDEADNAMDLDRLKAHISLDTRDDGNVQYFLYKNGIVTGDQLDWTGISDGGMRRYALRDFNFTNSDGQRFTVAADVARYSDYTYQNESSHLDGNLEEPSLTMRYIYYMRDAKEMATNLTACQEGSDKWLESKVFHFPAKQIFYEKQKKVGYRGEFIGLRHVFSDYWVFDGNGTDDANLVSAVDNAAGGKIVVEIVDDPDNPTGIRLGGWNPTLAAANGGNLKFVDGVDTYDDATEADFRGFYFYDKMSDQNKTQYGDSRFVVFRYPASGEVTVPTDPNVEQRAYINVYLNNNGTRYQLAQFTVVFDKGTVTLPYQSVNSSPYVRADATNHQYTDRDPKKLIEKAGRPIAKITFDYPSGDTYHFPDKGQTKQGYTTPTGGTLPNSSPIPLTFDKTNYSFSGFECNWGSYAMVSQMTTNYGNHIAASPANDNTNGYGDANISALQPDDKLQNGFLYIDASEQPGDICSAPFVGDFCAGDKLMFSGWISGSNKAGGSDNRCPGGITLTVKGEHNLHNADGTIMYDENGNPKKETVTLYRFCPGQIYELDNGTGADGSASATQVVWQQFYFEFTVTEKYDRHWIEVNNNCVSSQGGDFMLDNIAVYAIVPEVIPGVNTPLCVSVDENGNTVTDMRLLKLSVDFNKLKSSAGVNDNTSTTSELGFVFLDKEVFLKTFKTELQKLTTAQKQELYLDAYNFNTISLDALAYAIEDGAFGAITGDNTAYRTAFDAAILGNKTTWHSDNPSTNMNSSVLYFRWNSDFDSMEPYSFAKAVNKTHSVYREEVDGVKYVVMNGNYPELSWKTNTDYYIISSNDMITAGNPFGVFNICSQCTKASVFRIEPPYNILGLEKSEDTNDYVVCEGQIPTLLTDLKGFDLNGNEVPMQDLNYDWWLGNSTTKATLENYHAQKKGSIRLDNALSTLRIYYPDATDLDGIISHLAVSPNPALTSDMVNYLKELVDAGELVLHQKSISMPAEPAGTDDPYFYLVACPIHDEKFQQALNPKANEYVAFFCDEPQGLRVKLGEKAPTLKTGFVPGENTFPSYDYSAANDAVLSIRLAKKEQFERIQHGTTAEKPLDTYHSTADADIHFLWLPIRNAQTQTADGVIRKSDDYNIYLASTNDPIWDKNIYKTMKAGSLPIVGKIVLLNAINTAGNSNLDAQNNNNRLCIYFTENFEVREGYNYTLSLPFREVGDVNTCDGTILINLKIVPDYEVWTGAAGNTDWNNDENWRRADGNTATSTVESPDGSKRNNNELYRTNELPDESPLKEYVTNYTNYRTAKDRIFRKGFAPLYCTHVLIKSNEWGDAPQLYDALDKESGNNVLVASPFPNLRDTSTPILKYDMQARLFDIWTDTYGEAPNKGREGDLIAEMYQVNSCDKIAFQPGAEMLNAHLLNYNNAWVEYQLDNKRWYLLGSPLQGTISGEWYAPMETAQQKTTYYENVTFGEGYDRYNPAIYQRSWDKAKAVLYEVGAEYSTDDDSQTENLGSSYQGTWSEANWNTTDADEYLDRLGYKPMGAKKANVAIKGVWSNTYNDATVDYATGGFSVMVMNHLKGESKDKSNGKTIIRLPKEDTMYDYYKFSETGEDDGGTDTQLSAVQTSKSRALNRGRLKTDLLLPTVGEGLQTYQKIQRKETAVSRYGDERTYTRVPTRMGNNALPMTLQPLTETVSAGISNLGYYLVENPFPCGLNMDEFFKANTGIEQKYWLLTATGQHLVQKAADSGEWISPTISTTDGNSFASANAILAPGQGFFVQATTLGESAVITFNNKMQAQSRYGEPDDGEEFEIVVGTKQKMKTVGATYDDDNDPDTPEVPLMIDHDNDPTTAEVQATIEVPEVDNDGNFVVEDITEKVTVYKYKQKKGDGFEFPLKARATRGVETSSLPGLVITAQRGDNQSSALVMQREGATNDFLPSEDTEVFLNSDLNQVPTVYTLCGRLATTINSIHDFNSLPLGVESASAAPCTLTFNGVEMLGDSVAFYDAVKKTLTPLESGMQFAVSGQTQNRYYLVRSLDLQKAAEETHLQFFTEGLTAKVIASTAEPIVNVRCFDTAGQLIHSASPQSPEYSFILPRAGIYIIEAQTDNDRKTVKILVK